MTRRTYRLPPTIDRALSQHAKTQGVTPSVVVRDALSAYLVIEGTTLRIAIEIDALRREQQSCMAMLKELLDRSVGGGKAVTIGPTSDRVRARFEQLTHITHKEESHGNGNG